MHPAEFLLAFVTVPTQEVARHMAETLVGSRAAACVSSLGPVTSVYHWNGAIEHAEEIQLIIKTSTKSAQKVKDLVKANHPYEVPEVVFIPLVDGLPEYLRWIDKETD